MPEMQEAQFGRHQSAGPSPSSWPPRFLEGPDGVVRLYCGSDSLGIVRGASSSHTFTMDGEPFCLMQFEDFDWTWVSAMKLLQGGSIQTALGPRHLVVDLFTSPIWSAIPRMPRLVVAEPLFELPVERLGEVTAKLYKNIRPALPAL